MSKTNEAVGVKSLQSVADRLAYALKAMLLDATNAEVTIKGARDAFAVALSHLETVAM